MPTDQPNSAPDTLPTDARDDATVAAVLHDADMDDTPGGGGLGGAAAADRLSGSGRTPASTSSNSPIDVPAPDTTDGTGGMPASAEAQARREAVDAAAPEPHPSSR